MQVSLLVLAFLIFCMAFAVVRCQTRWRPPQQACPEKGDEASFHVVEPTDDSHEELWAPSCGSSSSCAGELRDEARTRRRVPTMLDDVFGETAIKFPGLGPCDSEGARGETQNDLESSDSSGLRIFLEEDRGVEAQCPRRQSIASNSVEQWAQATLSSTAPQQQKQQTPVVSRGGRVEPVTPRSSLAQADQRPWKYDANYETRLAIKQLDRLHEEKRSIPWIDQRPIDAVPVSPSKWISL